MRWYDPGPKACRTYYTSSAFTYLSPKTRPSALRPDDSKHSDKPIDRHYHWHPLSLRHYYFSQKWHSPVTLDPTLLRVTNGALAMSTHQSLTRLDQTQLNGSLLPRKTGSLVMLTAKHHHGFCLWPSDYTEYSVKASPWKEWKGDVVGELAEAAHKAGIQLGVYLSPWDRHEVTYGKTLEYNDYYMAQITELLTRHRLRQLKNLPKRRRLSNDPNPD
uniref:alpha-L-fucosidase n=1 Tax=Tanacetum cinerariifolium TaxID=118510 RepID=A0A6L2MYS0_TANCI|nr:alpha-L-fucosidase 1 [Tanacetum cinerariifolium]